jgi:hypothetical protein
VGIFVLHLSYEDLSGRYSNEELFCPYFWSQAYRLQLAKPVFHVGKHLFGVGMGFALVGADVADQLVS